MTTTARQMGLYGAQNAASTHAEALHEAQGVARLLAAHGRVVSADDVRQYMCERRLWSDERLSKALGNAMGLLFSGAEWEPVGVKQSTRAASRGRLIRTWRLK